MSRLGPIDTILIKAVLGHIELLHRQIVQPIHHLRRFLKRNPQRLPTRKVLPITVVVQAGLRVRINVIVPKLPLDEQNGGVFDAALVQDGEGRVVVRRMGLAEFAERVEAGGLE